MRYFFLLILPVFLYASTLHAQQAAEGDVTRTMEQALKVICPKSDDICKLLKELQIKVNQFREQEKMDDTEGLFANVEGIKYVFNLIDQRYKKMSVKPLELTHFLQSRYSFIVVYLHSYLDKYRKKLLLGIEKSWKTRKKLFAAFKKELETTSPNRDTLNSHRNKLAGTYKKLIDQNTELKEMYETLVPVYTELGALPKNQLNNQDKNQNNSIITNLKTLKEKIAEQSFLIRKLKQDLEQIPRD